MARKMTSGELAYLDTADFVQVMKQYAEESGKDFAESANRKFRDACLKAANAAPKASRVRIEGSLSPKGVASALSKKPRVKFTKVKRVTVGYTKSGRAKKKRVKRTYYRHYSEREARKYWKAVVGRRKKKAGFMRGWFISLARHVESVTPGLENTGGKSVKAFRGFDVTFWKATAEQPVAGAIVKYIYKKRQKSSAVAESILKRAWAVGLGRTILDTRKYIERKMKERANKYSVK